MVYVGHLLIAFTFIIGFYLLVTYSGLSLEMDDIKTLQAKIQTLSSQYQELVAINASQDQITSAEKLLIYTKSKYNNAVDGFNTHKKSIFAIPVLALSKKFDQEFKMSQ
ncbi:MAG: hypothetical protein K0Q57_973 [Gammaproteobacteria bacterium]|jgi:hypothetical protein|nr:hypothetical protein [Gammaproteobacteria bacterium]